MSYKKNRERVYEIYEIDINDKTYNCHHIVSREDYRKGLVPPDFDINALSNLYPMKITEHNDLHKRIDELEGVVRNHWSPEEADLNRVLYIEDMIRKSARFAKELKKQRDYKNQREIITRLELQQWRLGYFEDCS